jgi:hypothetical protein
MIDPLDGKLQLKTQGPNLLAILVNETLIGLLLVLLSLALVPVKATTLGPLAFDIGGRPWGLPCQVIEPEQKTMPVWARQTPPSWTAWPTLCFFSASSDSSLSALLKSPSSSPHCVSRDELFLFGQKPLSQSVRTQQGNLVAWPVDGQGQAGHAETMELLFRGKTRRNGPIQSTNLLGTLEPLPLQCSTRVQEACMSNTQIHDEFGTLEIMQTEQRITERLSLSEHHSRNTQTIQRQHALDQATIFSRAVLADGFSRHLSTPHVSYMYCQYILDVLCTCRHTESEWVVACS